MKISINGQDCYPLDPKESIHHEALCLMVGRQSVGDAMVSFLLPDGTSGAIGVGERAPLVDGAVYVIDNAGRPLASSASFAAA